jgi:hypothetical protein
MKQEGADLPRHSAARAYVETRNEERHTDEGIITQRVRSIDCFATINGVAIGVICPECVVEGCESRVHLGIAMYTHAGVQQYHEAGVYHLHDGNVSKARWTCTRGHAGDYTSVKGCPAKCPNRGYMILTSDPYNFVDALKERSKAEKQRAEQSHANVVSSPNISTVTADIPGRSIYYTSQPLPYLYPATAAAEQIIGMKPNVIRMQITIGGKIYVGDLIAQDN